MTNRFAACVLTISISQRGARLVEVRVSAPDGLRAVVWVNPDKGGTLYPLSVPGQTPPVTTLPAKTK